MLRLLGCQFRPRIAVVGRARLRRVDPEAGHGFLDELAGNKIDVCLIAEHRDDLSRSAEALKLGVVRAAGLTRTLRTDDRPTELARTLRELGRPAKTLHSACATSATGFAADASSPSSTAARVATDPLDAPWSADAPKWVRGAGVERKTGGGLRRRAVPGALGRAALGRVRSARDDRHRGGRGAGPARDGAEGGVAGRSPSRQGLARGGAGGRRHACPVALGTSGQFRVGSPRHRSPKPVEAHGGGAGVVGAVARVVVAEVVPDQAQVAALVGRGPAGPCAARRPGPALPSGVRKGEGWLRPAAVRGPHARGIVGRAMPETARTAPDRLRGARGGDRAPAARAGAGPPCGRGLRRAREPCREGSRPDAQWRACSARPRPSGPIAAPMPRPAGFARRDRGAWRRASTAPSAGPAPSGHHEARDGPAASARAGRDQDSGAGASGAAGDWSPAPRATGDVAAARWADGTLAIPTATRDASRPALRRPRAAVAEPRAAHGARTVMRCEPRSSPMPAAGPAPRSSRGTAYSPRAAGTGPQVRGAACAEWSCAARAACIRHSTRRHDGVGRTLRLDLRRRGCAAGSAGGAVQASPARGVDEHGRRRPCSTRRSKTR